MDVLRDLSKYSLWDIQGKLSFDYFMDKHVWKHCRVCYIWKRAPCVVHGGVTCHDFGYGCAAGVPEPHPIHIPGQVKNMTHSYTSHIENWPHSYTIFWKLTPFIYYFSNFTHSYTFWVKKIPHWYTFDVKNDTHSYTGRPEKYTPFQPHICIYLCNGSYPPVALYNAKIRQELPPLRPLGDQLFHENIHYPSDWSSISIIPGYVIKWLRFCHRSDGGHGFEKIFQAVLCPTQLFQWKLICTFNQHCLSYKISNRLQFNSSLFFWKRFETVFALT